VKSRSSKKRIRRVHAHVSHRRRPFRGPATLTAPDSSTLAPEQYKPVLSVPLDREKTLQSLSQIVAALKQVDVSLQTQAAVLDQLRELIAANWNREAVPQPRQRAPCTSGGFLVV